MIWIFVYLIVNGFVEVKIMHFSFVRLVFGFIGAFVLFLENFCECWHQKIYTNSARFLEGFIKFGFLFLLEVDMAGKVVDVAQVQKPVVSQKSSAVNEQMVVGEKKSSWWIWLIVVLVVIGIVAAVIWLI